MKREIEKIAKKAEIKELNDMDASKEQGEIIAQTFKILHNNPELAEYRTQEELISNRWYKLFDWHILNDETVTFAAKIEKIIETMPLFIGYVRNILDKKGTEKDVEFFQYYLQYLEQHFFKYRDYLGEVTADADKKIVCDVSKYTRIKKDESEMYKKIGYKYCYDVLQKMEERYEYMKNAYYTNNANDWNSVYCFYSLIILQWYSGIEIIEFGE